MIPKTPTRHPIGQQAPTPRRRGKPPQAQPRRRDTATHSKVTEPDPVMVQAKRDIDAGLLDTDMHATPALDAELRAELVPGPGGKSPPPPPHTLAEQKSDFTAEGSPPPGKVSTSIPARLSDPAPPEG